MQQNYKNYYTKGKRIYFKNKPEFYISNEKVINNQDFIIKKEEDSKIAYDGYKIKISSNKTIDIKYSNDRGLFYALKTLNELCVYENNEYYIEICEISDYPCFKLRGIIEGFYGKPYNMTTRKELLGFMQKNRLNTFFYAPKDDLYHRDKWRELYPEKELSNLKKLIDLSKENIVDFYYCISPGKDFRYADENEYGILFDKINQIKAIGCEKFSILLDDIDNNLREEDKKFETSGKAQAYLINRIVDNFSEIKKDLIICPTEYMQLNDSPYRTDLRENLPKDIKVFWTGYNTIAEFIKDEELLSQKKIFGNEIAVWDNYPVNDFEPKGRVYLGALSNRSKTLYKYTDSYVMNPMIDFQLSKSSLITASLYMWNSETYNEEESLRYSARQIFGEKYADCGYEFLLLNESSVLKPYLNNLDKYFSDKNFKYLDKYYENKYINLKKLYEIKSKYLESAKVYIELFFSEYKLYKSIRKNKIDYVELEKIVKSEKRNASIDILKYIKNNNNTLKAQQITIQEERTEYTPL